MRDATVLVLNGGSSTLKYGVYGVGAAQVVPLLDGNVELAAGPRSLAPLLRGVTARLAAAGIPVPEVIGHRVVHGGPTLWRHCIVDDAVCEGIAAAAPYAPLHTTLALTVIRLAAHHFPRTPQVACFDTHFHASMPDVASTLPIPLTLRAEGIRRYGFHGLSAASIVRRLRSVLPARLLIAHLGNGVSLTAVRDGVSVDNSMGLTPTGGVPMGTRSGDLDPGILLHLLRERRYEVAQLASLVDEQSGLLGLSGISGDMRSLHAAAEREPLADLAIRAFCYALRKAIGGMAAVLDGVDTLVFTGGIGEHDWRVRAAICDGLQSLGITLDATRNRASAPRIDAAGSGVCVRVMPAQEEVEIAHIACAMLAASAR